MGIYQYSVDGVTGEMEAESEAEADMLIREGLQIDIVDYEQDCQRIAEERQHPDEY